MKRITNELKEYIRNHHNGGYKDWHTLKFDGRKKMFRGMDKADFTEASEKHFYRIYIRMNDANKYTKSDLRKAYEYVKEWAKPEHGSYQKVAIYGNKHLWLASPRYGHKDYNKGMLLEVTGHENQCAWLVRVSERVSGLNTKKNYVIYK